ncbi:MAG: hypothetical protein K0Q52_3967 [Microbacterium sp.]|nr:hypothetical protein [Microbacterium sp.]
MDVMLDLERLRLTKTGLQASVEAFESAAQTNDALESAIGKPDDRSDLQQKVSDFEDDWKSNRGKLQKNLDEILKQLTGIIDGWDQWDTETANGFESPTSTGRPRSRMTEPARTHPLPSARRSRRARSLSCGRTHPSPECRNDSGGCLPPAHRRSSLI